MTMNFKRNQKNDNIILIGMSGAGKSTLGVLLAKALGKNFFDTDILIQQTDGRLLQQIIDTDGIEYFLSLESRVIAELELHGCVIATGGSVVYSDEAMRHLAKSGTVVYLDVEYEELARRLSNIKTRGIVFRGSSDLRSVYEERLPLYENYAEIRVACTGRDVETSVSEIIEALGEDE